MPSASHTAGCCATEKDERTLPRAFGSRRSDNWITPTSYSNSAPFHGERPRYAQCYQWHSFCSNQVIHYLHLILLFFQIYLHFVCSPQDIEAFREEMERRQMTEGSPPKVLEVKDEQATSTDNSSQVKSCS